MTKQVITRGLRRLVLDAFRFSTMPTSRISKTSSLQATSRRHRLFLRIQKCGIIAMRPCLRCTRTGKECKVSTVSDRCGECVRLGTPCDLAVSSSEFDRVEQQIDKLQREESLARESKKELKSKVSEVQAKVSEV